MCLRKKTKPKTAYGAIKGETLHCARNTHMKKPSPASMPCALTSRAIMRVRKIFKPRPYGAALGKARCFPEGAGGWVMLRSLRFRPVSREFSQIRLHA